MAVFWRDRIESILPKAWSRRGLGACLLWPISLIYRALITLRRQIYKSGVLKSQRVDAVVIVVGNVIVGGAGKTPTVISVVQHLQSQGVSVGVVSRGYGRDNEMCMEVGPGSLPQEVGDEPVLLHRATGVPVMVGRDRAQSANALLSRHPGTQVIVCDDGMQHYRLFRDIEICVFDDRGCGNGWLLPAGPLREPWPRTALQQAGQHDESLLVLHTGNHPAFEGFTAQRRLSAFGTRADGSTLLLEALKTPQSRPLRAVAGVAQPENFFNMLRAENLRLSGTTALPDHYNFDSLPRSVYAGFQLICTEKDAAKLWRLVPDAIAVGLIQTAEAAFFETLDACVTKRLTARLSSSHGHKIT
jgi:tetraacyldisaccharide 4'-kinase